jgi:hypothetical protein
MMVVAHVIKTNFCVETKNVFQNNGNATEIMIAGIAVMNYLAFAVVSRLLNVN